MKKNAIILIAVIALVVGVFVVLGQMGMLGSATLATTSTTGNFISVPTYGYLKCEEGDSGVRSPPIPDWQKFDDIYISCTQVGTLVDDCVVTFKMPSKDEVDKANSFLSYSVCTIGSDCGGRYTEQVYARKLFIGQDYDNEVNVPITKNQYIMAAYRETGILEIGVLFNPSDAVYKGRYAISYTPYFVYRYDVFSQSNGAKVFNTEDCTNTNNIEEANFIIEDISSGGKLSQQLETSELLNLNNLRAAGARVPYLSNFVAIVPQYDLFDEDGYTKYCYDKKIYAVEEITTSGGTYLVANTGTNAQLDDVDCCNNGDVPAGNKCVDFEIVPLSEGEDTCSALKPCPIIGYQPIAGRQVAYQECVNGQCVTDYIQVECNYDAECSGGYCNVDTNDPSNNECVTREPQDYCGNGVCEASRNEDSLTCSKDCEPPKPPNNVLLYIIIGIMGGLVLILLIYLLMKRQGSKPLAL